jgi:glycosyltransferase involved in cell wall biosynthesis
MNKLASLSIVIPCHNEEEVIEETYFRIKELIDSWQGQIINNYEIVLVNNGSTDRTLDRMLKLFEIDPHILILDLRNNYGYQGSITAGLFNATKDVIVSIDADLQDDPTKIRDMLLKYYEGYELVIGVREDRQSDSLFKRYSAKVFYWILNCIGIKSVMNHGDFRLLSRALVEELKKMPEKNRYLRGMIFELESKYSIVYYRRAKREAGYSKFNLLNLISLALDGITSFSSTPIRLVSFFGMFMFLLSIAGSVVAIAIKLFFKVKAPGWASLIIVLLFFTGVQSLLV